MGDVETAIRAAGLSKRFGDLRALDGPDLEVGAGEVLGYLGPNGAGKTTTIRLLPGMLRPTSGRAEIFGLDVHKDTVAHRRLAYVGGETSLWPSLTGAETLHLLARVQGRADPAYRDEAAGGTPGYAQPRPAIGAGTACSPRPGPMPLPPRYRRAG